MMHYLKAHNAVRGATISCILVLLAWWLAGSALPMPQLLQGRASPVETQLLLTVLLAPVTVYMFGRTVLNFEKLFERRLWAYDLLLAVILLAPACIVALIVLWSDDAAFSAGLFRNAALFVGLAFLCLGWFGETVTLTLPVGYFLLIGTIGTGPDGTPHLWAFPRAPADQYSLALAVIILVLGFVFFCRKGRDLSRLGR